MTSLKITAYSQPNKKSGLGNARPSLGEMIAVALPFEVQFNPENIVVSASKKVSKKSPVNRQTDTIEFISNAPKNYQFTLFMDGTGASGKGKWDVGAKVAEFMKRCYYQQSKDGGTSFLSISWGNFLIYCILESVTVTYKMFDPQGLPIRATLACNFVEYYAGEELDLAQTDWKGDLNENSPLDETLDFVLGKGFGDPNKAIEAAKETGLDALRGAAIHLKQSLNIGL